MSQGDHKAQPKRNGVLGHPFLMLTRWEKQTFDTWMILLCPGQVLTKGSDRAEKRSSRSPPTKSSRDSIKNSSKQESRTKGFWVLATKSRRLKKVHDLQPREWRTKKDMPCNSLTLFADARASKTDVFKARCLSEVNLRGSKGGLDKHLRTRDKSQSRGRISHGRYDLSKLWNIQDTTELATKSIPVKENTWFSAAWLLLCACNEGLSSWCRKRKNPATWGTDTLQGLIPHWSHQPRNLDHLDWYKAAVDCLRSMATTRATFLEKPAFWIRHRKTCLGEAGGSLVCTSPVESRTLDNNSLSRAKGGKA